MSEIRIRLSEEENRAFREEAQKEFGQDSTHGALQAAALEAVKLWLDSKGRRAGGIRPNKQEREDQDTLILLLRDQSDYADLARRIVKDALTNYRKRIQKA